MSVCSIDGEEGPNYVATKANLVFLDSEMRGGERTPHRRPFCRSRHRIAGILESEQLYRIFESEENLHACASHPLLQLQSYFEYMNDS
jgi:hypothetical protein